MPPEPPVPVSAVHYLAPERVVVTFNQPIFDPGVPLDPLNWVLHWNTFRWFDATVSVVAGAVQVLKVGVVPGLPQNLVTFDPPPFDVTNLAGVPAAAFDRFPVT